MENYNNYGSQIMKNGNCNQYSQSKPYVSQNIVYGNPQGRQCPVQYDVPAQQNNIQYTQPVQQINYVPDTYYRKKPKNHSGSSDRSSALASAVFFIVGLLCSGLGLGLSITGYLAPYWGYIIRNYDPVTDCYIQGLDYLDCDIIAVFSIIGIALFGIMLILSVVGMVMNFRKAKRQERSFVNQQAGYYGVNTAA